MSETAVKLLTQYEVWENRSYVNIKVRLTGITWLNVKRGRIKLTVSFQDRSLNLNVTGELGNYKLPINGKELHKNIIGDSNPSRSLLRRRYCRHQVTENYITLILRKEVQESWMNRSNEIVLLAEKSDTDSQSNDSGCDK
ncbi:uncharacterized protein [Ptychodera flava]|uniref:uncharacterized protein n=1 Tax=Ptychodera flava TaxID=63121 RepID=UPI00396AA39C